MNPPPPREASTGSLTQAAHSAARAASKALPPARSTSPAASAVNGWPAATAPLAAISHRISQLADVEVLAVAGRTRSRRFGAVSAIRPQLRNPELRSQAGVDRGISAPSWRISRGLGGFSRHLPSVRPPTAASRRPRDVTSVKHGGQDDSCALSRRCREETTLACRARGRPSSGSRSRHARHDSRVSRPRRPTSRSRCARNAGRPPGAPGARPPARCAAAPPAATAGAMRSPAGAGREPLRSRRVAASCRGHERFFAARGDAWDRPGNRRAARGRRPVPDGDPRRGRGARVRRGRVGSADARPTCA